MLNDRHTKHFQQIKAQSIRQAIDHTANIDHFHLPSFALAQRRPQQAFQALSLFLHICTASAIHGLIFTASCLTVANSHGIYRFSCDTIPKRFLPSHVFIFSFLQEINPYLILDALRPHSKYTRTAILYLTGILSLTLNLHLQGYLTDLLLNVFRSLLFMDSYFWMFSSKILPVGKLPGVPEV